MLFVPERLDRIAQGCFDGLVAQGDQGNDEHEHPDEHERAKTQVNAVGKAFEPPAHRKISQGGSHHERCQDEHEKIPQEQKHDTHRGSAQHFTDPNFLGALLGGKGHQAKQS